MISLKILIQKAFRVEHHLARHESYLAHLPKQGDTKPVETLAEHVNLVLSFFERLCEANGVEIALDNIIDDLLRGRVLYNKENVGDYIKQLFVAAIAFHDHGKINENFQTDRMRNTLFQQRLDAIIRPIHGHSALGACIFIVYHFENLVNEGFDDDDLTLVAGVVFVLADAIFLHHSPSIYRTPKEEIERSVILKNLDFLKSYLEAYNFTTPKVSQFILDNLGQIFKDLLADEKNSFALFALLRLNFSLLTASDYLATSAYMSGIEIKDLGIMSDELRKRIIDNSQNSEDYNKKAFAKAEILREGTTEDLTTERSGDNLNELRKRMAAEAINEVKAHADQRLFYLEAPTGGGKTNISMLVAAELLNQNPELNKVFYVFPFTTLITQTHKSILKTWGVSTDEVALMHSKAGFQSKTATKEENEDGLYSNQKLNQLNNLFAFYPICMMTHIRFFDMLKSNDKETIYLMHRLANSIVILDELQSYNPAHWDKMMYIIDNYARLFNIRFVLMSATLPKIDKLKLPLTQRPNFVELLPKAERFFTNPNFAERVQFNFDLIEKNKPKITLNELAEEVIDKSEQYANTEGSVHTIIEFIFKKSASAFKDVIDGLKHPFQHIFVLSGTILEPRRREIINFLKNKANRNQNILLITTQVVEAGVDIDMDLGFKNKSLIDSDEQLAGRVNRNVKKDRCTVYLFQKDDASMLYKNDYRFHVKVSNKEHADILEKKDFQKLYNVVLNKIDDINKQDAFVNFNNDYLPYIQNLDYKQVNDKFKLIDSKNVSIFVPIDLSLEVEGEKHTTDTNQYETVFSEGELNFLKKSKLYSEGEKIISGKNVWLLYRDLIENKRPDFTEQIVSMKTIQGILSKFTFSIFYTPEFELSMTQFINLDLSFEKYWYLSRHNDGIYDLQSGLMTDRFNDSKHCIL